MLITKTDRACLFNSKHRKTALHHSWKVVTLSQYPQRAQVLIDLRLYETLKCVYACLWLPSENLSGSGMAGGYGYDKASAAVAEAIHNASLNLSESISGRGRAAIEEALQAMAEHFKYKDWMIVECYP